MEAQNQKVQAKKYNQLTGPEKAAAFMLSLNKDQLTVVFSKMDEEEILELSHLMSNLGTIKASVIEELLSDFNRLISGTGGLVGSYATTEKLLAQILSDDQVAAIMEEVRGPAGRNMWEKLANVNEEILANYLKNEYPQTVAVVFSKIKSSHASKVLSLLPEQFALEVIMRMIKMEAIQRDVMDDVEQTLKKEFMSNLARASKRDPYEVVAEIFNGLERATEGKFMGSLEKISLEAAEKIRSLMFTFEDLLKFDNKSMQTLMRVIDKSKMPVALKGASQGLKELFFRNMSERASKILKDDITSLGPVRVKDVEEAQSSIVKQAKELIQKGEIEIAEGGSESQLIY